MTQPDTSTAKKALSAHTAMGLITAGILYIICLSGSLAMFHHEFQRLEQRDVPEMSSISDQALIAGMQAVLEREKDQPATTHLYASMPAEDMPRTIVSSDHQSYHIDDQGRIASPVENDWSEFIVHLHYTLNLPGQTGKLVGITIVGITGMIMLALSLSGVISLPRIFRDAFRLRARDSNGLALADWHNRLSVWTLPFSIAIALTGALIGLGTLTSYAVATAAYEGKMEAVYEPIFGAEAAPNLAPAAMPNIAAALADMRQRHPDQRISYVTLHDPQTKGQHIQIMTTLDNRLVFGEYYNFSADGRFQNKAGLSDGDLGQQAAASNYTLHFGTFGGMAVKILYAILGLAVTAICATGTYIWLGKRRRKGHQEPRLLAAWHAIVWGTPLAMLAALVARLALGPIASSAAIFWVLLLVITVVAALRSTLLSRPH